MIGLEGDDGQGGLRKDGALACTEQDTLAVDRVVHREHLGLAVDEQAHTANRRGGEEVPAGVGGIGSRVAIRP